MLIDLFDHSQLPGNLVVRKLGARNWLSFCVIAWGAVELSMAFVPTWNILVLCRVLLGAFEASFFPALVFIITTWYMNNFNRLDLFVDTIPPGILDTKSKNGSSLIHSSLSSF